MPSDPDSSELVGFRPRALILGRERRSHCASPLAPECRQADADAHPRQQVQSSARQKSSAWAPIAPVPDPNCESAFCLPKPARARRVPTSRPLRARRSTLARAGLVATVVLPAVSVILALNTPISRSGRQVSDGTFELASSSSHPVAPGRVSTAADAKPEVAAALAPKQVSDAPEAPRAVAARQELEHEAIATDGAENSPAGNEHQVESSDEARAPNGQGKALTGRADAKASHGRRAPALDPNRQPDTRRAQARWQVIRHCWSVGQVVGSSSTSTASCFRPLGFADGLTTSF